MQTPLVNEKKPGNNLKVSEGEHLIGEYIGDETGPTLIVFGSVHGNEAGGALALQKISKLMPGYVSKLRGRVYFLAGNTRAMIKGVRFIDSDLNRHWSKENVENNQPELHPLPKFSEDCELCELLKILNEIIETAQNEVYALDLHSTSAEGVPFATVGDTLRNRNFAQKFPITILLGIEEQLEGTILEYLNNLGAVTLGYEGGQHYAESTVAAHEALVWFALVNSGILRKDDVKDLEKHRKTLEKVTGKPKIFEIRYRHAITPADEFEMKPGYDNFQPIRRGELLAHQKSGEIRANETGLILMPLYQKLGEDGFFIGREVAPFWLKLSKILRRFQIGNFMFLLPGVIKHPTLPGTFVVNTQVAKLFPLQIFHLLGFRKRRWVNENLIVSQRLHDTKSPFVAKSI